MGLPAITAAMMMVGTPAGQGDVASVPVATAVQDRDIATSVPPTVPTLPPTLPTPAPESADDANAIVVSGKAQAAPGDPLEQVNAEAFGVTQKVDDAVVGPVAMAYQDSVPSPIRKGMRNFLRNLFEPVVFINYMLQLKPGKAAETAGRFAINTTVGIVGLVDAAKKKPFHLPYRPNGFANTMGYYGIKPGPFLYVPLMGPTTVRDLIGYTIDGMFLPFAVGKPFSQPAYVIPATVLGLLNSRVEFDTQIRKIKSADDPYAMSREYYLKGRQAEIDALHGKGNGKWVPEDGVSDVPPAEGNAPLPNDLPADTDVTPSPQPQAGVNPPPT